MPQIKGDQKNLNFLERIRYSIFPGTFRTGYDNRDNKRYFNTLLLHFRPRSVSERTLRFTLTWGLGGMAVVLILMLFGTGILMKFVYQPFPDRAYASILHLEQNIPLGQFIRNIHHWSGNILLIIVFLHFLRVFFTSAFHPPRQFNWIIGLCLFLVVLMSNFTGYLLPWDQLAFWAITICTGMLEYIPGVGIWLQKLIRGGNDVGTATLSNFYAIHTALLPILLIGLLPLHFWRVRKAGGLVIPKAPDENPEYTDKRVPGIPNLIIRELVVALVLVACILVFSALFNAPLEESANPGLSPNPTKAPWYFVGFQEILLHFHPLVALCLIPVLIVIALAGIPYVRYSSNTAGVWFASDKGRRMAMSAIAMALVAVPLGILLDEFVFDFAAWMPGLSPIITGGLIPLGILLPGLGICLFLIERFYSPDKNEMIQTVMVLFLSAFVIFTVTGIWFRGSGMRLAWPL